MNDVAAICQRTLVTVDRGASPAQAARLMRDHHVGAVVVTAATEAGQAVVGLVTDRDLAVEVLARGAEGAGLTLAQLVRGEALAIAETASWSEALERMQRHGVRRLLVTGDGERLVGLLALDDLLQALAAFGTLVAGVVRNGLEREAAERAPLAVPPAPRVQLPPMGTAGWTRPLPGAPRGG